MAERAEWMDRPHEFVEDVEDMSMCTCGIPALQHYRTEEDR